MVEGAVDKVEANMDKSEFNDHMAAMPYHSAAYRLANQIQDSTILSRESLPQDILSGVAALHHMTDCYPRVSVYMQLS